jgi:hypothetical protein
VPVSISEAKYKVFSSDLKLDAPQIIFYIDRQEVQYGIHLPSKIPL